MRKNIFKVALATLVGAGVALAERPTLTLELDYDNYCFKITSLDELLGVAQVVNGERDLVDDSHQIIEESQLQCYELTEDITLNTNVLETAAGESNVGEDGSYIGETDELTVWTPIGTENRPFMGLFRGLNHTIKGLYSQSESTQLGLFGNIGCIGDECEEYNEVIIDGINIEDSYFNASKAALGGIVGYAHGIVTIKNSSIKGITKGDNNGGLVGKSEAAVNIKGSSFIGSIYGVSNIGGLVGYISGEVVIENSYSKGNVKSGSVYAGGLVGYAASSLTIKGSYSEGDVESHDPYAGGLVGYISGEAKIENSYSKGNVKSGNSYAGGLVGKFYGESKTLSVKNSYYAGTVSIGEESSGIGGIVGNANSVTFDNVFYQENEGYKAYGSNEIEGAAALPLSEFANGKVALALHNYESENVYGYVWGQNIVGATPDDTPVLAANGDGKIILTVDVELNGGSFKEGESAAFVYGDSALLAVPVREGYIFAGLFTNENLENDSRFDGKIWDKVYAKWIKADDEGCLAIGDIAAFDVLNEIVKYGDAALCVNLTADITLNTNVLKTASGESNVGENGSYIGDAKRLRDWTPIGNPGRPFLGNFHGNGHTISGLYIKEDSEFNGFSGLFNSVSDSSHTVSIDNLNFFDAYVWAKDHSGVLAGHSLGALNITSTSAEGFVNALGSDVGGLVGMSEGHINMTASSSKIDMICDNLCGGFVGEAPSMTISNSLYDGSIKSLSGGSIGGYVGTVDNDLTIENSTAKGSIVIENPGDSHVGGLVGSACFINVNAKLIIRGTKSEVSVQSHGSQIGGLAGESKNAWIENSSSDRVNTISGFRNVGGLIGTNEGELTIKNSWSKGDIEGNDTDAGGLVGYQKGNAVAVIENSHAYGNVYSFSPYSGGLVGLSESALIIKGSYSEGNVESGLGYVGGLVGSASGKTQIENSYFKGNVKSKVFAAGGLVGTADLVMLSVKNSYYVGTVSANEGVSYLGGIVGNANSVTFDNVFYQENEGYKAYGSNEIEGATALPLSEFANGKVALALHNYESEDKAFNGKVWGQNFVGETPDTYPVLTGKIIYPIVAVLNEGSLKAGEGESYIYGETTTLPTPTSTRNHYDFVAWYTNEGLEDGSEIAEIADTVTGTVNIYAKWAKTKYTIRVVSNDGRMGSVTGAGQYEYGQSVKISAIAASGYLFTNWEDDVEAAAERTITVEGDAAFTANFKAEPNSSSEAKSSSSSEAKSSSSSKAKSSSSSKKIGIIAAHIPQFSITVAARSVQFAGATVGAKFAIFDMQGRVATAGRIESANFSVAVPHAGSYFVRVNGVTRTVNVK